MEKLSREKIDDLVGSMECGITIFYVKDEDVIKEALDLKNPEYPNLEDAGSFEEYSEYFEYNDNYEQIYNLSSNESYDMMKDFADSLTNDQLQKKLYNALDNRKPFRNFKFIIENSEAREDWFEFRTKTIRRHFESQIETLMNQLKDEEDK